ncbi:MAG TPA: helix-turn-helix domain-containing protein [Vicinamibacterales bacterium]|nr:helix-turn-helix domain-containing protein [Vicinamibacterales bacterium]
MSGEPLTYTVEEAAQLCQLSPDAVYEACRRGEFPHVRIGRRIRIPRRRFEAWLNGGEVAAEARPRVPSGY